jgi:hypothetical protein
MIQGRTAIAQSMAILLLSPILTTYIPNHDILIYLSVQGGFCIFFIFRSRHVISKWNTWLLNIPSKTDQEILDWYLESHGDPNAFANMTAPAAMSLARTTLYTAVCKERKRSIFQRPTKDKTVRKLAEVYPATLFLLDWYSSYMHAEQSLPYTTTWNLQTKVGLTTLQGFDKGIRLHNAFIHWRYAKAEIAYGTLYFLLALLDRWIELICGGRLIGLAVIRDNPTRIAIGLGLVYYLFGAVALDMRIAPLWDAVKNVSVERLGSASHLNQVAKQDARNLRRLYWSTLRGFLYIHVWGLAFVVGFFWTYAAEGVATALLLLYLLAYTGLLWFQYNKVFIGTEGYKAALIAVLLGFSIGLPLRFLQPTIFWNDVLALGVACWTAGILSFASVNLRAPHFEECDDASTTHAQRAIGPHNQLSSSRLDRLFDELEALPDVHKLPITLSKPLGRDILAILVGAKHTSRSLELRTAFPDAFTLLDSITVALDTGEIIVCGVAGSQLMGPDFDLGAISRKVDKHLKIYVGLADQCSSWTQNLIVSPHAYSPLGYLSNCENRGSHYS